MPFIAETERLIIRTWELKDVAAFCDLTRQEGISEFSVSGYENYSPARASQWIQKELEAFKKLRLARFAILLKSTEAPIGISGLFQMPSDEGLTVEINYRYPSRHRGQGYATEAAFAILKYGFDRAGLSEIYANVDHRNLASIAVIQRLGMTYVREVSYKGIPASRWKITKNQL